jgi:hypothetical protein
MNQSGFVAPGYSGAHCQGNGGPRALTNTPGGRVAWAISLPRRWDFPLAHPPQGPRGSGAASRWMVASSTLPLLPYHSGVEAPRAEPPIPTRLQSFFRDPHPSMPRSPTPSTTSVGPDGESPRCRAKGAVSTGLGRHPAPHRTGDRARSSRHPTHGGMGNPLGAPPRPKRIGWGSTPSFFLAG